MPDRRVDTVFASRPTVEGAGVHLKRAFGNAQVPRFDPFLMLDDFHTAKPEEYLPGFPWHPHRGIETVTYILDGRVEHGDSLGNSGVIGPGEVQWMTAGSGVIHQEMPKRAPDGIRGFQLWVNLPAARKMMDPRYRAIAPHDIPEVALADGARVKIICGEMGGVRGPARDIVADPGFYDVFLPPGARFELDLADGRTAAAYVIEGQGSFGGEAAPAGVETAVLFKRQGGRLSALAGSAGFRFLLFTGAPIGEPVAWYGPIVMNTDAELRLAFEELEAGTFVKTGRG